MNISEVWIKFDDYIKEYEKQYPFYMIKIQDYVVLYQLEENLFYTLEEAIEFEREKRY